MALVVTNPFYGQKVTVAEMTQIIADYPGLLTVQRDGVNICHTIAKFGTDDELMRLFLDAIRTRPDVYNAKDPQGSTPLMLCAWLGKTDMAMHLLAMPCIDVEVANEQMHTAVTYAVHKKDDILLAALLGWQLKIETLDSALRTAFAVQHHAAIAMLETKRNGMPLSAGIVV